MRLPNIITLGRLLSVPLTIWFILDGRTDIAFWVFAAAGASDAIDGFIAKHFDQVSELGRFLDPIADKVLVVSIFLTLGQLGYLPLWLVILVVSRDALIVGGAVFSFVLKLPFAGWPMMISKVITSMKFNQSSTESAWRNPWPQRRWTRYAMPPVPAL